MLSAYRKERANGATAINAIRAARYATLMGALDYPRYPGDDVVIDLPRGESIVMRLEYDPESEAAERLGATVEPVDAGELHNAPDYWQGRNGVVYVKGDRRGEYYSLERDGCTLAQDVAYLRRTMGRHAAYLAARENVDAFATVYRAAVSDGYVGYVVELRDADGEVIDEDSVWGFEASDDCAGQEARAVADSMAAQRASHWETATVEAKREAANLRLAYHAMALEIRALERIGPNVCVALRQALATLRQSHRSAVAVIAGGAT